jgi:tetratricopeptide (TPR) repeat protein
MSRSSLLLFSLLLLFASISSAQEQGEFKGHTLRGTVVNSDSTPVNDAMVEIRNMQSGSVLARAYTSGAGEFQVTNILPGQYLITVVDGMRTTQQQITFSGFDPDVKISVKSQDAQATGKGATVSVANLRIPEKAKKAVESAQKALSKNKLEEAAVQLQRALSISPQYPEALSLSAVVYLAKGDFKTAMENANRSVEIDPSSSLSYTILGASYNAGGKFLEAVESLRKALKIDPNFWQSHYEMAKSFYGQGRTASALVEIDSAGRGAPRDFAEIHLVRGAILMQLHRTADAANEWQQFLKLDPKNPEAAKVERTLATISQPETNSRVVPSSN